MSLSVCSRSINVCEIHLSMAKQSMLLSSWLLCVRLCGVGEGRSEMGLIPRIACRTIDFGQHVARMKVKFVLEESI